MGRFLRASSCVVLIVILVCCAFDSHGFLAEALNSDLLLPASLFWDIGHRGWQAAAFQLPRVPSFVPDLALWGAAQLPTGNWRLAYLVYAIGTLSLLCLCAGRIAGQLHPERASHGAIGFLAVAAPVLGIECLLTRKIEASVHLWLLMPVSHGGAFIFSVAAFLALKSWMDRPGRGRTAPLVLTVFCGMVSDKLFVVFFCLPGLAVFLLLRRRWRLSLASTLIAVCCCGLAVGLASLCDGLLLREPDLPVSPGSIAEWSGHALRLAASPFRLLATEAPLGFALGMAVPLVLFLLQKPRGLLGNQRETAFFWWLAALFSMGASLLACSLLFTRLLQYRYLAPFLWWPILWAGFALQSPKLRRYHLAEGGAGLSLLLLGLHFFSGGLHRPALFTWRDPLSSCLLELKDQGRISAGLAEYWFARYLEVTSDWRLQVQPISAQGALYYWGDDPYWSLHALGDDSRPPAYDFVLVTPPPGPDAYLTLKQRIGKDAALSWREENSGFGMQEASLRSAYGEPAERISCPGSGGFSRTRGERVEIWRYGEGNDLLTVLKRAPYFTPGLPLTFPPETFVAAWPRVESEALRSHPPGAGAAFYGPSSAGTLLDLPSGRFRLALRYKLRGAPSAEVTITADGGHKAVTNGSLPATTGEEEGLAEIPLELKQPERYLDVIVTVPSEGDVTLKGLQVEEAP